MTDEKKTDKPVTGSKDAAGKSAVSKESPADKAAVKKTDASSAADKSTAAKAAESKAAGSGAASSASASSTASPKKRAPAKKLSAADKKAADESIRSKQSADDLKARAAAAKKRAQEKILDKNYVSDPPVDPLERLADTFDNSARRWEMVVYPSLFAFVLLAGYGFFLIYRLTHDISTLSQSVTRMAVIVSDAMPRMTKDLNTMTASMDNMTGNIDGMSTEMSSISNQMNTLTPMSQNISSMTHNLGSMNRSVYGMQRDMHGMNRTVSSGPFGMMNDMLPFSSDTNVPPPMAPPVVWPNYNPAQEQPFAYQPPGYRQQKPATKKSVADTQKPVVNSNRAKPANRNVEAPGKPGQKPVYGAAGKAGDGKNEKKPPVVDKKDAPAKMLKDNSGSRSGTGGELAGTSMKTTENGSQGTATPGVATSMFERLSQWLQRD